MRKIIFIILVIMGCNTIMAQKWEKIGDRPQMGWSTWNKFAGNINEELVRGIADALVETGCAMLATPISTSTTAGTASAMPTASYRLIRNVFPVA